MFVMALAQMPRRRFSYFPSGGTCLAHPGIFLDTPLAFPTHRRFLPIEDGLQDRVTVTIRVCDFDFDVTLDRDGEHLHVGMWFKEITTSEVYMFGARSCITVWHPVTPSRAAADDNRYRLAPMFRGRTFLDRLRTVLIAYTQQHWPQGGMLLDVTRRSDFDGRNVGRARRTRTCTITPSMTGLYRLLGMLAGRVRTELQMTFTPRAIDFHLRFWGCKWISRVPTDATHMGFWVRERAGTIQLPVVPVGFWDPDSDEEW